MDHIESNMEEYVVRLSAGFEKLQYLVNSINQKFEKPTSAMTSQEKEAFIYERENIRIHLDIADDYVHEEACIVNELLAELQRIQHTRSRMKRQISFWKWM